MTGVEKFFAVHPYGVEPEVKNSMLVDELSSLTRSHRERCVPYRNMLDSVFGGASGPFATIGDLPFIPARLFKTVALKSVPDKEVFKTLTSSGTTSQVVSRIAVDAETATLQTKALAAIMTSFIGPKRLPMIMVDSKAIISARASVSARGAGLLGLSNFGRDHFFALDEGMRPDTAGLSGFLQKHAGQPLLIFGFTFMVWRFFRDLLEAGGEWDFSGAILIHSGGWKKLQEQAVSNQTFKKTLRDNFGVGRVHNFYGMVEQVGSVFMECENGYLHSPSFAETLIRRPGDWAVLAPGEEGYMQTLSVLPRSYPGHSLLTEDLGTIHGLDGCPCGRRGTYFTVRGRAPRAELRGCSDTHAYQEASA